MHSLEVTPWRTPAFVTVDKNLSFQQSIAQLPLSVVVLRAETTRLRDLRRLVPALREALPMLKPGELRVLAT